MLPHNSYIYIFLPSIHHNNTTTRNNIPKKKKTGSFTLCARILYSYGVNAKEFARLDFGGKVSRRKEFGGFLYTNYELMESLRDPKHESNTDVSPIGKVYSKHFGRSAVHCPQFIAFTILALSSYKLSDTVDPCKITNTHHHPLF